MTRYQGFIQELKLALVRHGIEWLEFDGNALLRIENEDAYTLRVRRADDCIWHWMPIDIHGFDLSRSYLRTFEVARTLQRICRWFRVPYKHVEATEPVNPVLLEVWQEEMDAAQKQADRDLELFFFGGKT